MPSDGSFALNSRFSRFSKLGNRADKLRSYKTIRNP
jgi:hypothetical protein